MKDKKSVIIAVVILAAIVVVGAAVGIRNFKNADELADELLQQTEQQENKEQSSSENIGNENSDKDDANKDITASDSSANSEAGQNAKAEENTTEENTKTPVFMYFVSEDDADYDEAVKVFEELKKEYKGKIDFDLKNVTKDPKLLENFSLVNGNTPALIMDGKEGITGFRMKTSDKQALKEEIEKALK